MSSRKNRSWTSLLSLLAAIALPVVLFVNPAVAVPAAENSSGELILAFGPTAPQAYGLDDMVIKFINGAKESLDMAFYEFRLDSVVDATIRAKKRGVKVRIVTDDDNYFFREEPPSDDAEAEAEVQAVKQAAKALARSSTRRGPDAAVKYNPFVERLIKAGIEVKEDNGRGGLMHNKFAVRDGVSVWTGSYNLTDTCSYKNPNNAMIIPSPEVAEIYAKEFKAMFEDRLFGAQRPSIVKKQPITVGDSKVEIYFAPEDNPNARIAELIAGAKQEILFMQFAFTADELGDLLVKKLREGLKVSGVFDRILYRSTGPYGEFSKLTDSGVPVKIYSGDGKFHHKVFIIDPRGANPIVVLGSQNASSNGNKSNDENIVIVYGKRIAELYAAEFKKYEGVYSQVTAEISNSDLPMAGTTLAELDLMIFGNGLDIDQVQIDFPARWSIASQSIGDVHVLRGGRETTVGEKLTMTSRSIILNNAKITGTRAGSWLQIRFTDVWLPTIPGKYSMLCSVKRQGGRLMPLRRQPTIWVLDDKKDDSFQQLLVFMKRLNLALPKLDPQLPEAEKARQKKRLVALNRKADQLVCAAAREGNFPRIVQALDFVDSLPPDGKKLVFEITGGYRNLLQALQYRVSHNKDEKEAKALLERLQGFSAEFR